VWLAKATELTATRGNENYDKAAEILAEVRDAIGGPAGRRLACKHAQKLIKQFPTMHVLKSAMRKQDLVD
jgi:hypothetical protein